MKGQEWEYKVKVMDDEQVKIKTLLNHEGAEGWELAAFDFHQWTAIFKRPVAQEGLGCKCQPTWPPYAMIAYD